MDFSPHEEDLTWGLKSPLRRHPGISKTRFNPSNERGRTTSALYCNPFLSSRPAKIFSSPRFKPFAKNGLSTNGLNPTDEGREFEPGPVLSFFIRGIASPSVGISVPSVGSCSIPFLVAAEGRAVKAKLSGHLLSPFAPRKPRIFRGAKGDNTRQYATTCQPGKADVHGRFRIETRSGCLGQSPEGSACQQHEHAIPSVTFGAIRPVRPKQLYPALSRFHPGGHSGAGEASTTPPGRPRSAYPVPRRRPIRLAQNQDPSVD